MIRRDDWVQVIGTLAFLIAIALVAFAAQDPGDPPALDLVPIQCSTPGCTTCGGPP
jgi:hypothetical protein